jgi:hypothetical protein
MPFLALKCPVLVFSTFLLSVLLKQAVFFFAFGLSFGLFFPLFYLLLARAR